jgi:hypothetical protein
VTLDEFLDIAHDRCIMTTFRAGDGHLSLGMSSRKQYERAMAEAVKDLWITDFKPWTRNPIGVIPGDKITIEMYWKYHDWNLWTDQELLKNPNERIQFETEMNIARNTPGKKRRAAEELVWDKWDHLDFGVI